MALFGCDSFVVLPPLTANGDIIFGKNSDRPNGEVQEVVYYPSKSYSNGAKLQCTYIEIDQVQSTHAVLLSKPAWMWGAEMGANNCGLVIGNEAVFTVVDDNSRIERLLGMDLLRLGLERASNSWEAVKIITTLLQTFGQGGPCSDTDPDLLYHNSFLIADQKEAWVLETAGKLWAAEKITSGFRNISNCLSISCNITERSHDLETYAKENKLWNGLGEFSFKDLFSASDCPREAAGCKLLANLTSDNLFDVERMIQVLSEKKSGICRPAEDPFHTSGSWVSSLSPIQSGVPPCHWFTATPDPSISLFKPFVFTLSPVVSSSTVSPTFTKDPAKGIPRFQFKVDRKHKLYKLHRVAVTKDPVSVSKKVKVVEKELLACTHDMLKKVEQGTADIKSCDCLMKNAVEKEISIYSS